MIKDSSRNIPLAKSSELCSSSIMLRSLALIPEAAEPSPTSPATPPRTHHPVHHPAHNLKPAMLQLLMKQFVHTLLKAPLASQDHHLLKSVQSGYMDQCIINTWAVRWGYYTPARGDTRIMHEN